MTHQRLWQLLKGRVKVGESAYDFSILAWGEISFCGGRLEPGLFISAFVQRGGVLARDGRRVPSWRRARSAVAARHRPVVGIAVSTANCCTMLSREFTGALHQKSSPGTVLAPLASPVLLPLHGVESARKGLRNRCSYPRKRDGQEIHLQKNCLICDP